MIELAGMMWWLALGFSLLSAGYILSPLLLLTVKAVVQDHDSGDGSDDDNDTKLSATEQLGYSSHQLADIEVQKTELVVAYRRAEAAFQDSQLDAAQWQQRKSELESDYQQLYQQYQRQYQVATKANQ